MNKNGFWHAGACFMALSGAACATHDRGSADAAASGSGPIVLAQANLYEITRNSYPTQLKAFVARRCNPNAVNCAVTIDVSEGCSKDPSKIKPDSTEVQVPKERKGRPMPIVWHINTSGWSFQNPGGIEIYQPGELQDKGLQPNGNWVWVDKADNGGRWRYAIRVKHTGGEVCELDPTVVNDW